MDEVDGYLEERKRNRVITDQLAKIHDLISDLARRNLDAQAESGMNGGSVGGTWHGLEQLEERWICQQPPVLKRTFRMDDDLCDALRVPKQSRCFVVQHDPDYQYRGVGFGGTRTISIVHIGAMRRQKNFEEILTNLEAICLLRFKIG